jgi:hypothetical protein
MLKEPSKSSAKNTKCDPARVSVTYPKQKISVTVRSINVSLYVGGSCSGTPSYNHSS